MSEWESSEVNSSSHPSDSKSLTCPDCGTLNQAPDGVSSFPKNLVLLQVHANSAQPSLQKQPSLKDPKETHGPSDALKALCPEHSKKLEAFCEKCHQVLCIDCILSDSHKAHEIVSVAKAVERQRQALFEEVGLAQRTEEKLRLLQSDVKKHVAEMHATAERNRRELSAVYSYVRDLLLEREQALKRSISETLTKEEQEAELKLKEIAEFMSQILGLKQELLSQSRESEIEVLLKAKRRAQLSADVNRQKELPSF